MMSDDVEVDGWGKFGDNSGDEDGVILVDDVFFC